MDLEIHGNRKSVDVDAFKMIPPGVDDSTPGIPAPGCLSTQIALFLS